MPIAFQYADDAEREHAERLAVARQQLAHEGEPHPTWEELTEEERKEATVEAAWYLRAGRRAGLYGFNTARPVTAMVRDINGQPISRDDYEAFLRTWIEKNGTGDRLALMDSAEMFVVAALLDELCGVYPKERLGQLAREVAVELNDRRGI
ncbi:hypothetical protein ACQPYK_21285 [Streptosporangium sp. CA-135522]|uniref:hypothetical protein n=1 Tax=Streptosporangium sp. CA-135522 TaxID=3240072 RepID=UPI003D94746E